MINDGVCDELTNIENCLYDGGDCCLENKNEALCRVCTCQLVVQRDYILREFDAWNVSELSTPSFLLLNKVTEADISEVASLDVCSTVCLGKGDTVNAWSYDLSSRMCQCVWISSDSICSNNVALLKSSFSFGQNRDGAFISIAKTIPCGNT